MQIVDFSVEHIEAAVRIAKHNYEAERERVPALPPVESWPDMSGYAQNGLGVAAFDGDTILGFLCCWNPFDNAFGISGLRGVFSPMGANGTTFENRAKIYARLYQAAGEKWARAGAASHAVCLYAHDTVGQEQFYRYGFGMRSIDAIRETKEDSITPCSDYTFCELSPENILDILPLDNYLDKGFIDSPFFMYREQIDAAAFLQRHEHFQSIYFVARHQDKAMAFIRAELDGETFIRDTPGYLHVKGAYCLPEHRGKGLHQTLLNLLIRKLKAQGYTRLGVDFESFNPSGSGFWLKHFAAYTHGVVRRIDESAISNNVWK